MEHGRIFVLDEFDKAPVEVVVVLKGLLEDGELLLGDGRRFVSPTSPLWTAAGAAGGEAGGAGAGAIAGRAGGATEGGGRGGLVWPIHPNFRVVALANRPGFPFLGNDVFSEMGDCFACHVVDNPDNHS